MHHQCHHSAVAGGTGATPHLHQQHKGAGLGQIIGEVEEGVPLQLKAPILVAWMRGSARCHATVRGWVMLWVGRSSPPTMVYASVAVLGLPSHARQVTGWRPPDLAMTRSSCTSGVHTGAWSGMACQKQGKAIWHPWCLHLPWFT